MYKQQQDYLRHELVLEGSLRAAAAAGGHVRCLQPPLSLRPQRRATALITQHLMYLWMNSRDYLRNQQQASL